MSKAKTVKQNKKVISTKERKEEIKKNKITSTKLLKVFLSSFFAGIVMALTGFELIASYSWMPMEGMFLGFYFGAFIQSFGLLLILYFNLDLFNCRLCDVFNKGKRLEAFITLAISLIINIATIIGIGSLFKICFQNVGNGELIKIAGNFVSRREIQETKTWYMTIVSAIMCAVLCYTGGYIFKKSNNGFVKFISVFFAVGIYVISGFENLMTNTMYASVWGNWTLEVILDLVGVLVGNVIGTYLMYFIIKGLEILKTKISEEEATK